MKNNSNPLFIKLILSFILLHVQNIQSQLILSTQDSLYFEQIKNDTTLLRVATNLLGTRLAAKSHNRLGYLAFKNGKTQTALNEFLINQNVPVYFPEKNESNYFIGRIKSGNKEWSQAKNYLNQYLQKDKNGVWADGAHYYLIRALYKLKDADLITQSRKYLNDRSIGYYAKDVQYHIVSYYVDKKDYSNAVIEAKKLIQKYPDCNYAKDMIYQIGDFYYKQGKVNEAKQHYREILTSNPVNTEPAAIGQFLLAAVYEQEKDFTTARAEYKKVKQLHPTISNWAILSDFKIAHSYFLEGGEKKDSALQKLNEFVSTYPTDKRVPRAFMILADMYSNSYNYVNALQSYDKIIAFDINNVTNVVAGFMQDEAIAHDKLVIQAHLSKAQILRERMRDYDSAIREYNSVLTKVLSHTEALLGKAITLVAMDKKAEARVIFQNLNALGGEIAAIAQQYLNILNN